jgi:predicted DNA-binding protein with PD1-like motif
MKIIHQQTNQFVLKLDRGEELIETLKKFCQDEKISAAFFVGLGASSYLKVAWYNLETKQYEEKEFNETLEIAGMTGNVAMLDDKMIVHVHGSFSDKTLSAFAGHITKLVIGGAGEIKLDKFETTFKRQFDPETGLNLFV